MEPHRRDEVPEPLRVPHWVISKLLKQEPLSDLVEWELLLDWEWQRPSLRIQPKRSERPRQLLRWVMPLSLAVPVHWVWEQMNCSIEHLQVDPRGCRTR